ncbi:hypothetical protein Mal15_30460 [Stieleria maiorica]|uniref:Chain length determinant protein n=1 Tax=Stieleria maiorica TaxID=2795974 RepID=A0A5B9MIY4_9BACT|nr:hypothetical protein [Stieleria maiorica]QEF98987.1 hypothetical protein Mal15_30460 [Stieleria maiorica]
MSAAPIPWKHIRNVLVLFAPLWIGAVLVFGLIGVSYSFLSSDIYAARQPLVVRDEATRAVDRLGRFASQTELKAAQETILEMAQNREVVAAALREIGPPDGGLDENWPPLATIDGASSSCVNILAPQGAEFGNTEVVYLEVKSEAPDRAVRFCHAMFDSLTKHLRDVRRVRADSVIVELTHARDLAKKNLDEVSDRMREIEVRFGADLGELRNLNDTYAGDSSYRRSLATTKEQLQTAELDLEKLQSLHALLVAGAKDPNKLLISGGDLLNSQPSLQRLKDGLIDAQLRASQLSGVYTLENPKRKAAIATEREIRERIIQETNAVIASMQPMLELQFAQVKRLSQKVKELSSKLQMLAEARTMYAEIDSELQQRSEQLAEAEQRLVDARASRSAALSTNLVAALGPPQVSDKPIGPGTTTMTFGSMMAGLIFGLGAVFLIAPGPTHSHGRRRWTDHLEGQNRRAEDRARLAQQKRRSSDVQPPQSELQHTPPQPTDQS